MKLSGSLFASDSISFMLLRGDAVGTIITKGQEQIIGRKVRKDTSLLTYTFVVYAVAGLCMSVLMLFSKVSFVGYSPTAYLLFFALAVIPQLLGHSSFNYALRYKSSALVSVALLGEPIGSVILAFLLLKEIPAAAEIAGGAFILIGIYLVSRSNDG